MADENMQEESPWHIGQRIRITAGPFAGMEGVIEILDPEQDFVRVKIDFFGRQTPVELSFSDLEAN